MYSFFCSASLDVVFLPTRSVSISLLMAVVNVFLSWGGHLHSLFSLIVSIVDSMLVGTIVAHVALDSTFSLSSTSVVTIRYLSPAVVSLVL